VHPSGDDPHEVEIAAAWDRVDSCNIDQEGFALRPCRIAFDDFGNDRAARSGPLRVRQVLPDEADAQLQGRIAFFNLWKPLRRVAARAWK
jgi:hypothetical protein